MRPKQGSLTRVMEVLRDIRNAKRKYDDIPGECMVSVAFESVTNSIREDMDRWEDDLVAFLKTEGVEG